MDTRNDMKGLGENFYVLYLRLAPFAMCTGEFSLRYTADRNDTGEVNEGIIKKAPFQEPFKKQ
jgi:hypothetical protein